MTTPQYSTYPGLGEWAKEALHYQQAVKIGKVIKVSGQGLSNPSHFLHQPSNPPLTFHLISGGWNPHADNITIPSSLDSEIAQAFSNVELALKAAGGQGWKQVYSVRSYHIPVDEEATAAIVKNLEERCGLDHRPLNFLRKASNFCARDPNLS
jgi:enamine deaminase RidA (YjgF/YER057c/UK114 family)